MTELPATGRADAASTHASGRPLHPAIADFVVRTRFEDLPAPVVEALAGGCADGAPLTVNLERRMLIAPSGAQTAFTIDPLRREALLHGLDDIGLTLRDEALIRAWQQADRLQRPWAWPPAPVAY